MQLDAYSLSVHFLMNMLELGPQINKIIVLVCLAGDIQMSTYPGRIIVTEPKGAVQPRINVEKHSLRHVVLNGQTTLPCIAQGKN